MIERGNTEMSQSLLRLQEFGYGTSREWIRRLSIILLLKRPDSRSYCFFAAKVSSASNASIPTGEYGCICLVVNRFKALHGPNRRPVLHP